MLEDFDWLDLRVGSLSSATSISMYWTGLPFGCLGVEECEGDCVGVRESEWTGDDPTERGSCSIAESKGRDGTY